MKIAVLKFITEKKFQNRDVEKLRGFFANKFRNEDLFHNHSGEKDIYRMPLIQYKVINGILTVYGINEGADLVVSKFLNIKEININGEIISEFETELSIKDKKFLVDDELHSYKFDSIWLALNDKNHIKYKKGELNLNKVLQNNILSNFKGCGIKVEKKIMVKGEFKEVEVYVKNIKMIGFVGKFICNVEIPKYMGVGKRKSIGFGVLV